jgi:beta-glucosidase
LSYASFKYSNPRVDNPKVSASGTATVSVDVTNTGVMTGDEVVQLYLTHSGVASAPLRALKGFQRVHLDRNQRETVSFTIWGRDLGVVDEAGKHRIVPGRVDVWIGGGQPMASSSRIKVAGTYVHFTITDEASLPD